MFLESGNFAGVGGVLLAESPRFMVRVFHANAASSYPDR